MSLGTGVVSLRRPALWLAWPSRPGQPGRPSWLGQAGWRPAAASSASQQIPSCLNQLAQPTGLASQPNPWAKLLLKAKLLDGTPVFLTPRGNI